MGREKSRMKGLYMLWNMVDGREKTELYQVYEAVMKELDLPVLKTFLLTPSVFVVSRTPAVALSSAPRSSRQTVL